MEPQHREEAPVEPTPMVVAFRLTPEEHEAFRKACDKAERSMSGQLRVLVRDWLRDKEDGVPAEAAA